MARLNEAPLPTESLDALKRRFVRQNRELAKNNSAQCLRIRALECEVSRLLAENLNLREEIVHLQGQLSEPHHTQIDTTNLTSVKDQLQAKLLEFGALVSELGQLQITQPSNNQPKNIDPSSWRPEYPAAILSGQAPRMSGISEEIRSPGGSLQLDRTLNMRLSDQSNGSPDLGPPPVVHFENDDPIKFDPLPAEVDSAQDPVFDADEDEEESPAALSVNLETRRRRKDGSSKVQLRRSSLLPPDLEDDDQPELTRTSAKRKLSVREAEDKNNNQPTKDDFKFSRRSSIAANMDINNTTSGTTLEDTDKPSLRPERKVLGNKSVNTSPRKLKAVNGKDDLKKTDDDAPLKPPMKLTERSRKSRNSTAKSVSIEVPATETIVQTVEIPAPDDSADTVPPKTPLPDLFSPTPSEQSTARDEGRDTPPPSGLKSMTSGPAALNGASRPSRRARAAVNYAEPNLVSKMRRPTADYANAIDQNGRRISGTSANSEKKAMRTVVIKGEDMARSSMGQVSCSEPASPLGQKTAREQEQSEEATATTSASGRTIAALMASSKARQEEEDGHDTEIYELKDSSPIPEDVKMGSKRKGNRRHSSVAGIGEQKTGRQESNEHAKEVKELRFEEAMQETEQVQEKRAPRTARVDRSGSRRRSMMV